MDRSPEDSLLPPLNDKACLSQHHDHARAYMATPEARALAARLVGIDDLIAFIRDLEQRDDLGDPDDGPRLPCIPSQRLRVPALDPNCGERTTMFLAIAPLIDPELTLTSATLMLDNGLHTFPVEIRDGVARPVILDPMAAPRNAMLATVYELRNASPLSSRNLGPWFTDVAQNACIGDDAEDCYDVAMDALRRALVTGEPIDHPDELACVLSLTEPHADLFGARGRAAYQRVCRSIRNLSIALDTNRVGKFLNKLAGAAEPLASNALKAALTAQFGPAAMIALQGVDLATEDSADAKNTDSTATTTTDSTADPSIGSLGLTLESRAKALAPKKHALNDNADDDRAVRQRRLRRMTFAFREQPPTKDMTWQQRKKRRRVHLQRNPSRRPR